MSILLQQDLLDAIRMQEIVERDVAKHDEHRVVAVFAVLAPASASPLPTTRESARPAVHDPTRYACSASSRSICSRNSSGSADRRVVRRDHRRRFAQHLIEPAEEQAVHVGQVTRLLVGRPAPRRRTTLQQRRRHLAHQRHDDAAERVRSRRSRASHGVVDLVSITALRPCSHLHRGSVCQHLGDSGADFVGVVARADDGVRADSGGMLAASVRTHRRGPFRTAPCRG